jgi:hypothetical protein
MSRSYKKTPYVSDKSDRWAKRQASKKARKADIGNGCAYKKVYCSWNIKDYGRFVTDEMLAYMEEEERREALNK